MGTLERRLCMKKRQPDQSAQLIYHSRGKSHRSRFRQAVYALVATIPKGETLSYSEVARRAGFPGAARAVGTAMKANRSPRVPCHRVIRADGRVGDYAFGGRAKKRARLQKEGVLFDKHGRVFPRP